MEIKKDEQHYQYIFNVLKTIYLDMISFFNDLAITRLMKTEFILLISNNLIQKQSLKYNINSII